MKTVKKRILSAALCALLVCTLLFSSACETRAFRANYKPCEWGVLDRVIKILPENPFSNEGAYILKGNFSASANHGEEVYSLSQEVKIDFERFSAQGGVDLYTKYLEIVEEKTFSLAYGNDTIEKRYADGKVEKLPYDGRAVSMLLPEYIDVFYENFKRSVENRTFPLNDVTQDYSGKARYLKISVTDEVAAALFFESGIVSFSSGEIFVVQDNVTGHITNLLLRFNAQGQAPDVVTSSNGLEKISTEFYLLKE